MRIGVISDIHSNLPALRAVLEDMGRVDELLCAGDLVGYASQPNEVVDLFRTKGLPAVMGNHDYAAVTGEVEWFNPSARRAALWTKEQLTEPNRKYLRSLPEELRLTREGVRLYVVHGSPRDPLFEYVFPDLPQHSLLELVRKVEAEVILLGHTHVPMRRLIQGKLVLNPGGVGQPRDRDPRASYLVLEVEDGEVEAEFGRVEYDVEEAAEGIRKAGLPPELASRLFVGW
ncbi:MAG: metallophosphoesterase family protein [Candidatus Hadarchaeales archaeon]